MPLYTGDYLRDTQHLSCSEHGIYLKLLMHCWDQKGPAPLDERKLLGVVNARSTDEIEAMRRVLSEFFVRMDDGHYNARIQGEIERSDAISGARSEAGKKGYQAKAKQLLAKSKASAKQVPLSPSPSPSLPQDHLATDTVVGTPHTAAALAPKALKTVPVLPEFSGLNAAEIPGKSCVALAAAFDLPAEWGMDALALGWSKSGALKESERFRQYWVSGKGQGTRRSLRGWRQTWSNWLGKAEKINGAAT